MATAPGTRTAVRYRVPEGVIDRSIGDELLIHRFETDEVFVLNPHARIVFEAAKGAGDEEEVVRSVLSRVFADTFELIETTRRALDDFVAKGLLVREA